MLSGYSKRLRALVYKFQAWQISHLLLRAGPAKDFEAPRVSEGF